MRNCSKHSQKLSNATQEHLQQSSSNPKWVGKSHKKSNMATAKWSGHRQGHFELSSINLKMKSRQWWNLVVSSLPLWENRKLLRLYISENYGLDSIKTLLEGDSSNWKVSHLAKTSTEPYWPHHHHGSLRWISWKSRRPWMKNMKSLFQRAKLF